MDRKYLLIVGLFMQIIIIFFDVFFNVYVYDIAKDLTLVMGYSLFRIGCLLLLVSVLYRFLNQTVVRVLHRLSFVMGLVSILLTFTISADRLYMVFITQAFYAMTLMFYYIPHEIGIMSKNTTSQMKKFVGLNTVLSLCAGVFTPFISGVVIEYVSYYVLFGFLSACAIVCFVLSFKVDIKCSSSKEVKFKDFLKESHATRGRRFTYYGYAVHKFSQDGIIDILLPVLIFMRTGGNFSVGLYASLATLAAGIMLLIYVYFNKNKRLALDITTAFLVITSIVLIIWNSIVIFFIYYFVKKIATSILKSGIHESVFTVINGTPVENFKTAQFMTYNLYNRISVAIAYSFGLLVYNFVNNEISITIILVTLSLCQIVSTVLVNIGDKLTKKEKELAQEAKQAQEELKVQDEQQAVVAEEGE